MYIQAYVALKSVAWYIDKCDFCCKPNMQIFFLNNLPGLVLAVISPYYTVCTIQVS